MLFNDWLVMKLKEVGKTWHDFTKAGIGGQTMYNIQHGKYRTLKDGTCQKLALVLGLCQGDIRDAIVQSIKEEDAPKETEATEQVESVEQDEPEELPFGDLEPAEEEEADMKWYKDKLKEEKPKKVKVKPEAVAEVHEPQIIISEAGVDSLKEALETLEEAAKKAIDITLPEGSALRKIIKSDVNMPATDPVNHPAHYTQGGIECIDAIEASMSPEEFRGYLKGCNMKYLWRYQLKGGVEDLRKAQWYLNRLIKKVEK